MVTADHQKSHTHGLAKEHKRRNGEFPGLVPVPVPGSAERQALAGADRNHHNLPGNPPHAALDGHI